MVPKTVDMLPLFPQVMHNVHTLYVCMAVLYQTKPKHLMHIHLPLLACTHVHTRIDIVNVLWMTPTYPIYERVAAIYDE